MDGTEEKVPVGACRIVLERDSGPRPEARKEERGKRVSAETLEACAPIGLHLLATDLWDQAVPSLFTWETCGFLGAQKARFGAARVRQV